MKAKPSWRRQKLAPDERRKRPKQFIRGASELASAPAVNGKLSRSTPQPPQPLDRRPAAEFSATAASSSASDARKAAKRKRPTSRSPAASSAALGAVPVIIDLTDDTDP
eukprot:5633323-Prymnesium_polylepis.1